MEKLIDYSFIPVPRIYQFLDDKCFRFIVFMIDKERFYRSANKLDSKGYFFMSNEKIGNVLGYSTKTINNIVETLYRAKIIDIISEGKQGKMITNRYYVNYEVLINLNSKVERVDRNEIKSYRGQNSTSKINFGQNSTDRDSTYETYFGQNSTGNFGQNSTVYKSISSKSIKNNIYGPNIGPNIYSYIEGKKDFSSNSKVNCSLSKEEIEEYNNSVNSSEAESNFIAESETVNNRDNSNLDNTTANAESGIEKSVNSNIDNSNKEEKVEESVNSNSVIPNNNLDNSNNVNTAVLSPSNPLNEESVISTKKISENGLKQAKTRELEIINKTDNSNLKNLSTANAVTEETVYSNSVKPVIEGIEGENKTDNSNLNINSTIAEGDNSTANAVSEFRNKCTNYTIILEGKKIEIDRSIDEFIESYFNELNNNIYDTKEFDKQRKIFNRMIVDNQLTGSKYDEMCDKLDVRYSRYVELDNQLDKSKKEKEFTQEEAEYIANELLKQCLEFTLTKDNRMQDFYNLRNNYNAFIEQYNIPKEGFKLQTKFAELSVVNKKLNTPVNSQSFAV